MWLIRSVAVVFVSFTTKSDARDHMDFPDEWLYIRSENILIHISCRKNNAYSNHNEKFVLCIKSDITNESLKIKSCFISQEF